MSEKIKSKLPVGYLVMWLVIVIVYDIWMTVFMRYDTYPLNETGMTNPIFYPIWTVLSCVILLLFALFIRALLFGKEPGRGLKIFCLINLIFSCTFVTWYGFFKSPLDFTASMIGLEFPWHFKMWGVFASLSIFSNTLLMYRKHNFYSRVGVIFGSLGCAAIFVTINVPSAGEELILNSLRCMSHWTGALVFAAFCAVPIVIFLCGMAKRKEKKYLVLAIAFVLILVAMLVLLVTVGKDGIIESLPVWATYLLLFFVNFTSVFDVKSKTSEEKELAAV